jgi:hypothetical protein
MPATEAFMNRRSFSRIVLAAAWFVSFEAWAQVPFIVNASGYSVVFPAKPNDVSETPNGVKTILHVLAFDQAIFLSADGVYPEDIVAEEVLQKDVDNFAIAVKGTITARRRTEFTAASGEKFPEVEFTFDAPKQTGKGIVIVTGLRTSLFFPPHP